MSESTHSGEDHQVERRLAAILAADVAGYSRLMGLDEEGTLAQLKAHRRALVDPKIKEHHGRIVKTTGDGLLVEFASVVDAVRCAVDIQRDMIERNADVAPERRIQFRIGVNVGDIIFDGDDIFGDGVNVAARLEAIAEPGGICVSRTVRDYVRDKLSFGFVDSGELELKNIARPVRVFQVKPGADSPGGNPAIVQPTVRVERLSIVVLPFANLSADREQEYFADGIVEDLTTDLSRLPGSFVIARNTAFTYKGKAVDAKQLGRELGVRYLLEGSVRRIGNQVRTNVQLVDTQTGGHLWADRFDGDAGNLAAMHEAVTSNLAATLGLELIEAAARGASHEANPDAVDLVLRARGAAMRPRTRENVAEARDYFERALKLAPELVEARIGLADILSNTVMSLISENRSADLARADELVSKAIASHPKIAWAHYVKGEVLRAQHRTDDAARFYQAALALDRNYVPAIANLGYVRVLNGQSSEAIPLFEQAIRMSPRDPLLPIWYSRIGLAEIYLEHFDRATATLETSRSINPTRVWCHLYLAANYALLGRSEDARASLADAQRIAPELASIADYKSLSQIKHPHALAIREKTLVRGLQLAGLPEA